MVFGVVKALMAGSAERLEEITRALVCSLLFRISHLTVWRDKKTEKKVNVNRNLRENTTSIFLPTRLTGNEKES